MDQLTFVSCHATNLDDTCRGLIEYLADRLEIPIHFRNDMDWTERYAQLDSGQVDLAWICGAPYVRRMAWAQPNLELLAAPVWQGERYGGKPVYFADVVVHSRSNFRHFAELQGAHWVYNEPGSLSGYAALLADLAQAGYSPSFFGQMTASGAHLQSLALLLAGQGDVTCIDSVVLAEHLRRHPAVQPTLRLLRSIGPLPSMPWVVGSHVPVALRQQLRHWLLTFVASPAAQKMADSSPLLGFAAATDQDYEPIRQILLLVGE
jgi:phosphonate transport system substrate-binding protein